MRIAFAGASVTLQVPNSPEFLATLEAAAPDWPFAASQAQALPIAIVSEEAGEFSLAVRGGGPMRTTAVGAACGAVAALATALVEERPDRLCFHCGAALFDGRLVVFPNRYRAGKSTLIVKLAAMGQTIFGDDILPVSADDSAGIAPGLAPRLRIPLPPAASRAFRNFVERHSAVTDGRYAYLRLSGGRLAPREAAAPLGAVVLLEREDRGRAEFRPASKSAVLRALIERNFARTAPSGELLDRMHRLMDRLPRITLCYSDFEEAAELLAATFVTWPPPKLSFAEQPSVDDPRPIGVEPASVAVEVPSLACETKMVGKAAVTLHQVDGELFLADPEGLSISHLNTIGTAIWNLLAEPISQAESIDVLYGAFPDADRSVIASDVATIFAALSREGLIVPAEE